MSQIFRALKKAPRSNASGQSIQHPSGTGTEEAVVVKLQEKPTLGNSQKPIVSSLTQDEALDIKADKETIENARAVTSVADLRQYCEQIDEFIETAQSILDRAYASDEQKILQRHLKNSVNELLSIQNQMKAVMDNIKSVKLQIAAIRDNIDDHKNKYADLKIEERRTRFLLAQENNKREKDMCNQEKSVREDFENKISKYFQTSTVTRNSRLSENNTALTNYFSIPNENEITINTFRNSQNSSATNRLSRPTNRQLSTTVKRVKTLRPKKEATTPLIPQSHQSGVTVFLHPIKESERTENIDRPQSRHSTPNASIANFTWFNGNQPDQTQSDTGANSAVSASDSLFVFNSRGRIEDLD